MRYPEFFFWAFFKPTAGPAIIVLIRLAVGLIFFSRAFSSTLPPTWEWRVLVSSALQYDIKKSAEQPDDDHFEDEPIAISVEGPHNSPFYGHSFRTRLRRSRKALGSIHWLQASYEPTTAHACLTLNAVLSQTPRETPSCNTLGTEQLLRCGNSPPARRVSRGMQCSGLGTLHPTRRPENFSDDGASPWAEGFCLCSNVTTAVQSPS